jgi:hypothetical protein
VLPNENSKKIITYTNRTELKKAVQNWKNNIFINVFELYWFFKFIEDLFKSLYHVFDIKNLKKTITEFTSNKKKNENNVFVKKIKTKNILRFSKAKKKSYL